MNYEALETVAFLLMIAGVALYTAAHSATLFEQLLRGDLGGWGFAVTYLSILALMTSICKRRRTGDTTE